MQRTATAAPDAQTHWPSRRGYSEDCVSILRAGSEVQVVFKDLRNMKAVAVTLLLGAIVLEEGCATGASPRLKAPPSGRMPVAVENLNEGRIRLERAGQRLVLNLARQISGCTDRTYDHTVNEEYDAGVDFEIVDEIERAPYTYLVLLASAPPNCNIQGMCGAAGLDSTLFWLKVTKDLSLAGKQALAIKDCRAGRYATNVVETGGEEYFSWIQSKDLPWIGDVLTIEYQEEGEDSIHRLIYDRQDPEAGFQRNP